MEHWAEKWLSSQPWTRYSKAQWAAFGRLMAWLEALGAERKVTDGK